MQPRITGLKKTSLLFITFLVIWTPYRYLTGILGWKVLASSPLQLLTESVVKLIVSFGLVYIFLRKYGDSWRDIGVKSERTLESTALALTGSSLLVITYLAMGGEMRPKPLGLLYLFSVVGPAEELMNRGYYFSMVMKDFNGREGFLVATFLSSLYFSLSHIPIDVLVSRYGAAGTSLHLLFAFLAGLILAGYYHLGGDNLLGPSIVHAMMDFCNAYIAFRNSAQTTYLIVGMIVLTVVLLLLYLIRDRKVLHEGV